MKNKIKDLAEIIKTKGNKIKASSKNVQEMNYSLVENRKGKCVVCFPTFPYAEGCIPNDIGFISILEINDIHVGHLNIKNPEEVVFEFDKKYTSRIKSLEKAYFAEKIKVDASVMSDITIFFVNRILPSGPEHNFSGKRMKNPRYVE